MKSDQRVVDRAYLGVAATPLVVGAVFALIWVRGAMSMTAGAVGAWAFLTIAIGLSGGVVAVLSNFALSRIPRLEPWPAGIIAVTIGCIIGLAIGALLYNGLARPATQ